jgi:hypothetical protein
MPKNMCQPVRKKGKPKSQTERMALFNRICVKGDIVNHVVIHDLEWIRNSYNTYAHTMMQDIEIHDTRYTHEGMAISTDGIRRFL